MGNPGSNSRGFLEEGHLNRVERSKKNPSGSGGSDLSSTCQQLGIEVSVEGVHGGQGSVIHLGVMVRIRMPMKRFFQSGNGTQWLS